MTTTQKLTLGRASLNTKTMGVGMSIYKLVQTLLNGYENPAVLSKAETGGVVYVNDATRRRLGIALDKLKGSRLHDHFSSRHVLRDTVIWQLNQEYYEISEEKIHLGGQDFIKSVLKPVNQDHFLDLLDMQKEMAKLLVHRFHSPLNGVAGFTELLKDQPLTDQQARYVEAIEKGLNDFKDILSNIQDIAERPEVQLTAFDAEAFANNIIDEYPPGQRKRIELEIAPELIELKSDYVLLKAIIKELLNNALQHSPDEKSPVQLTFTPASVSVRNSSPQIPKPYAKKMFYPFFSDKARNIGLGLPKCVLYAKELGYRIVLEENSSVRGITFAVRM